MFFLDFENLSLIFLRDFKHIKYKAHFVLHMLRAALAVPVLKQNRGIPALWHILTMQRYNNIIDIPMILYPTISPPSQFPH